MTISDDKHIVNLVLSGHTDAFVHIVRRYQRMVFTMIVKIVVDREEAEDITQEVFIKVFESLGKFRGQSEFSTWLYRVAYNTTMSQLRKRRHEYIAIDSSFDNLPDEDINNAVNTVSTEEKLRCLDRVLSQLPPDDAMLITMFYLDKRTIHDISTISGLSLANVKVKLHRIRKFMNFEINKLIQL